jgi:hypothetical protein
MLDNKKVFDVLTPMSDFHRVSYSIKDREGFSIEKGLWAKMTNEGLVAANDPASGISVLCLNDAIASADARSKYEANDVKVGSITAIQMPGIRVTAGESFFVDPGDWNNSVYNAGVALKVVTSGPDTGKLKATTPGNNDYANAIIESVDNKNKIITYVLFMGLVG